MSPASKFSFSKDLPEPSLPKSPRKNDHDQATRKYHGMTTGEHISLFCWDIWYRTKPYTWLLFVRSISRSVRSYDAVGDSEYNESRDNWQFVPVACECAAVELMSYCFKLILRKMSKMDVLALTLYAIDTLNCLRSWRGGKDKHARILK